MKTEKISADFPDMKWWTIEVPHEYLVQDPRNPVVVQAYSVFDPALPRPESLNQHKTRTDTVRVLGKQNATALPGGLSVAAYDTFFKQDTPHEVSFVVTLSGTKTTLLWTLDVENAAHKARLTTEIENLFFGQRDQIIPLLKQMATLPADQAQEHIAKLRNLMNGYPLPEEPIKATVKPVLNVMVDEKGHMGIEKNMQGLLYLGLPDTAGNLKDFDGKMPRLPHAVGSADWKLWMRHNGQRFRNAGMDDNSTVATLIFGPKDAPYYKHVAVTMLCDYDAHPNGAPMIWTYELEGNPYRNMVVAQDVIAREQNILAIEVTNKLTALLERHIAKGDHEKTLASIIDIVAKKPRITDAVLEQLKQRPSRASKLLAEKQPLGEKMREQLNRAARAVTGAVIANLPSLAHSFVAQPKKAGKDVAMAMFDKVVGRNRAFEAKKNRVEASVSKPIADLISVAHGQRLSITRAVRTDTQRALQLKLKNPA